jgi:hypothetical protein
VEGLQERCESVVLVFVLVLSSEERAEGRPFRAGDGGSVGTDVVVVMVVIVPAFCFDSVDAWRAYLRRFARFWFEARCEDVPSPAKDIAVDSDPCCEMSVADRTAIVRSRHL